MQDGEIVVTSKDVASSQNFGTLALIGDGILNIVSHVPNDFRVPSILCICSSDAAKESCQFQDETRRQESRNRPGLFVKITFAILIISMTSSEHL